MAILETRVERKHQQKSVVNPYSRDKTRAK